MIAKQITTSRKPSKLTQRKRSVPIAEVVSSGVSDAGDVSSDMHGIQRHGIQRHGIQRHGTYRDMVSRDMAYPVMHQ
jgi:hypothetical protein